MVIEKDNITSIVPTYFLILLKSFETLVIFHIKSVFQIVCIPHEHTCYATLTCRPERNPLKTAGTCRWAEGVKYLFRYCTTASRRHLDTIEKAPINVTKKQITH